MRDIAPICLKNIAFKYLILQVLVLDFDRQVYFIFYFLHMMIVVVLIYTHMSVTPLWFVMIVNVLMMMGILSRMVRAVALTTAIPDHAQRGAFMSINSSLQQIEGGVAAAAAGMNCTTKNPVQSARTPQYGRLCNGVYFLIKCVSFVSCECNGEFSSFIKHRCCLPRQYCAYASR